MCDISIHESGRETKGIIIIMCARWCGETFLVGKIYWLLWYGGESSIGKVQKLSSAWAVTKNLIQKIIHEEGLGRKKLMCYIFCVRVQPPPPPSTDQENTKTTLPFTRAWKSVNNLRIDFSNNMKFHFFCALNMCVTLSSPPSDRHQQPLRKGLTLPVDDIKNSKYTFATCLMGLCHFNIKNESNNAFIHVL